MCALVKLNPDWLSSKIAIPVYEDVNNLYSAVFTVFESDLSAYSIPVSYPEAVRPENNNDTADDTKAW
jgi:hypothetical protein